MSWASPVRFCGVMKAWKADVSLLRLGDSKPLRSPRGDCTGKQAHVRACATRDPSGALHVTSWYASVLGCAQTAWHKKGGHGHKML